MTLWEGLLKQFFRKINFEEWDRSESIFTFCTSRDTKELL